MEPKIGMLAVLYDGAIERVGTIMSRTENEFGGHWVVLVHGLTADADDPADFVARYCVDRFEHVHRFDSQYTALVHPVIGGNMIRFERAGVAGLQSSAPIGVYLAREVDEWPAVVL